MDWYLFQAQIAFIIICAIAAYFGFKSSRKEKKNPKQSWAEFILVGNPKKKEKQNKK